MTDLGMCPPILPIPLRHGRPVRRVMSPAIRQVLEAVCQAWEIESIQVLRQHSRVPKLTVPRYAAARLLRERVCTSWSRTAAAIGRADHTTAIHAVRRAEELLGDDDFARRYAEAEKLLDSWGKSQHY